MDQEPQLLAGAGRGPGPAWTKESQLLAGAGRGSQETRVPAWGGSPYQPGLSGWALAGWSSREPASGSMLQTSLFPVEIRDAPEPPSTPPCIYTHSSCFPSPETSACSAGSELAMQKLPTWKVSISTVHRTETSSSLKWENSLCSHMASQQPM